MRPTLIPLVLALLGGAASAHSHSLAPPELNVKAYNSLTMFSMTAQNRFERSALFTIKVYEDLETLTEIPNVAVRPKNFMLQPSQKMALRFRLPTDLEEAIVCSERTPGPGENAMFITRVCSRINLHHQEH